MHFTANFVALAFAVVAGTTSQVAATPAPTEASDNSKVALRHDLVGITNANIPPVGNHVDGAAPQPVAVYQIQFCTKVLAGNFCSNCRAPINPVIGGQCVLLGPLGPGESVQCIQTTGAVNAANVYACKSNDCTANCSSLAGASEYSNGYNEQNVTHIFVLD